MSHSLDESYDVYSKVLRTARKAHVCCACHQTIEPGHRYAFVFVVFDGDSEQFKRCARCELIHRHLQKKGAGETYPAEALDCGETYEDHWDESPPEEIARLAFVTPDEAQALLGPVARRERGAKHG